MQTEKQTIEPNAAQRPPAPARARSRRCIMSRETLPTERLVRFVVAPDGTVLPCQAAGSLPGLEFWRVSGERDLAACWSQAPGMNRYRGESWMPEPCRSCEQRGRDFGGCRCQAFHLTGDAGATDPACELSPHHDRVVAARTECDLDPPLRPRGSTGN